MVELTTCNKQHNQPSSSHTANPLCTTLTASQSVFKQLTATATLQAQQTATQPALQLTQLIST